MPLILANEWPALLCGCWIWAYVELKHFITEIMMFVFTARVGKTSLIMSLVSEEFPEEVNSFMSFLYLKSFKFIKIELKWDKFCTFLACVSFLTVVTLKGLILVYARHPWNVVQEQESHQIWVHLSPLPFLLLILARHLSSLCLSCLICKMGAGRDVKII